MDDNVTKFELSDEFFIESAERRIGDGDFIGALTVLNKRATMYEPSADAWALYADVYEQMGLWDAAADAWFRFLDCCNEADFCEGYEGLAVVFMNLGQQIRSLFFLHLSYGEDEEEAKQHVFEEGDVIMTPKLRVVGGEDPYRIRDALDELRRGNIDEARKILLEIDDDSTDHPTAMGLAALCRLLSKDEEGAEEECRELVKQYPDNVQVLTTFCSVLSARDKKEEAKEIAARLADHPVESADDLYRIATSLCETGMDEEAERALSRFLEEVPYDEDALYCRAVACYHLKRYDDAISSLELLTTLYPRKAVAYAWLRTIRSLRDEGGQPTEMSYVYRLSDKQHEELISMLTIAMSSNEAAFEKLRLADSPKALDMFRMIFDELNGKDEELQYMAVDIAVRAGADTILREVLLDQRASADVKTYILHELTMRNEENSFGVVILGNYREFFTHHLLIGPKMEMDYLDAFADVYSRFAIFGAENEGRLITAGEDVYRAIFEASAWRYVNEKEAVAAVIYREARLPGADHSLANTCVVFDADRSTTEEILDFLM